MNENKHSPMSFPADRGDFLDWATSEDDCCISVGGLAIRCGLVGAHGMAKQERPLVLGQLIEHTRRRVGLSLEELSRRANVALAELFAIEHDNATPTPQTLFQLAQYLCLPFDKLQELAGFANEGESRRVEAHSG